MIAMAQLRHRPEQRARISDNLRRPEVETKKPANAGFRCFTTVLFKNHHTQFKLAGFITGEFYCVKRST